MRKIDQLNQLQREMMEARTKVEDLCHDWGWTLSDKATNDNEIVEELKMQLDIAKEELAYYHDVEKDYNNDIKLFQEENAKLIDENIELEGQILGLNNQIKELQAKIEELTNAKSDSIVKKHVEGDDAMEQHKAEPKKNTVKEVLETEEIKEQTKEYAIDFKQVVRNEKVNSFSTTMSEIYGEITIDKTYKFKATNNYYTPIVYGCFDEKVALQARQIITDKVDRFNLYSERTTNDVNFKYAKDKLYPIVVWRLTDDHGNIVYHAYAKLMNHQLVALTWDKEQLKHILSAGVRSLSFDGSKRTPWRKLDNEILADKFMTVCADIWPEDFTNESEDTNEIVVDCTNDATAGCDDLDI